MTSKDIPIELLQLLHLFFRVILAVANQESRSVRQWASVDLNADTSLGTEECGLCLEVLCFNFMYRIRVLVI